MEDVGKAYISAGSNLGDRRGNLKRAIDLLRRAGAIPKRTSSIYETEPVGFRDQPWFLNEVIEVGTNMAPMELLLSCQAIEAELGRVRSFRNAPRTMDLDILLYGNMVIERPGLVIPHPRMAARRFVLEPLAEIAPDAIHPQLGRTIASLLQTCADSSAARLFSSGDLP